MTQINFINYPGYPSQGPPHGMYAPPSYQVPQPRYQHQQYMQPSAPMFYQPQQVDVSQLLGQFNM